MLWRGTFGSTKQASSGPDSGSPSDQGAGPKHEGGIALYTIAGSPMPGTDGAKSKHSSKHSKQRTDKFSIFSNISTTVTQRGNKEDAVETDANSDEVRLTDDSRKAKHQHSESFLEDNSDVSATSKRGSQQRQKRQSQKDEQEGRQGRQGNDAKQSWILGEVSGEGHASRTTPDSTLGPPSPNGIRTHKTYEVKRMG
jgi:hypothetical protein